jgi:hypothetical protein
VAETPAALHAVVADAFNGGDVDALMEVYPPSALPAPDIVRRVVWR